MSSSSPLVTSPRSRSILPSITGALVGGADAFLGSRCAVCGSPGRPLCPACASALEPAGQVEPLPTGLDACAALVLHTGTGRQLVLALKYRANRGVVPVLSPALATLGHELLGATESVHRPVAVTWAPTLPRRARHRGFDQARTIARAVAVPLGLPALRLLQREPGVPQTGRSRPARRQGPRFVAVGRAMRGEPMPSIVVLVDDVITTGATFSAAASALRGAGVEHVVGLALSQTPLNRRPRPAEVQGRSPPR